MHLSECTQNAPQLHAAQLVNAQSSNVALLTILT